VSCEGELTTVISPPVSSFVWTSARWLDEGELVLGRELGIPRAGEDIFSSARDSPPNVNSREESFGGEEGLMRVGEVACSRHAEVFSFGDRSLVVWAGDGLCGAQEDSRESRGVLRLERGLRDFRDGVDSLDLDDNATTDTG